MNELKATPWLLIVIASMLTATGGGEAAGAKPRARRLQPSDFHLIGGWRLKQEYPRGALAIDFDTQRVFMGGHAHRQEIVEFSLARRKQEADKAKMMAPGVGDDVMKWPQLDPVKVHRGFWEGGYVGGLYFKDGMLWASPKKFYDTKPPASFHLYGKNLATGKLKKVPVQLPRQAFGGGFVKGHPKTMFLGCGGYESGQGSVSGPTLATMGGKVLIGQPNHGTREFEKRERRPPTYWPVNHTDNWIALKPRNGVGRWACDRVHAGGIWHARGVAYWALLGIGELDYKRQNETFAARTETWLYTYDPRTYDDVKFNKWEHGHVHGHDVAPDGRVYLLIRKAWGPGRHRVHSVIKVFEIVE